MTKVGFSVTSDGLLKCNLCDYITSLWSGLVRHVRNCHLAYCVQQQQDIDNMKQGDNNRNNKGTCQGGKKMVDTTNNWSFHSSHYRCLLCHYRSLRRHLVTRHIFNAHMTGRPFRCRFFFIAYCTSCEFCCIKSQITMTCKSHV
jgi:hypothetical protein